MRTVAGSRNRLLVGSRAEEALPVADKSAPPIGLVRTGHVSGANQGSEKSLDSVTVAVDAAR